VTIEDVRALASQLPRSYEALVADRVKFRVGRIVYLAFSRDEDVMGFAFPKEERQALVASEPQKFEMPRASDLRYNWVHVRLDAIDRAEMRELVLDAWRMVVPKRVAAQYEEPAGYDDSAEADLDAGDFATWIGAIRAAIQMGRDVEVPCHGCTACCTSGQFVDIGPEETDTLAHIPPALLAPAPRRPAGHMVLGYDERGHCPMLVDGSCSIYEHRPRACRTYDCRVFAATGIEVEAGQPAIGRRVRRWRFDYPTPADRDQQQAARAAGAFLERHPDLAPVNAAQRAVLALEVQHRFVRPAATPDPDEVRAEIRRRHAR
jgi:Fe-S-cluster containining protein